MRRVVCVLLCLCLVCCLFYEIPVKAVIVEVLNSGDWEYCVDCGKIWILGYYGEETVIKIPETIDGMIVSTIHEDFSHSTPITEITIPASVTYIDSGSFSGCTSLQKITLEQGAPYTFKDGILYNANMTELVWCVSGKNGVLQIPTSVTSIKNKAFTNCNSLQEITIPASVTGIGYNAFSYCGSLQTISVESNSKDYASKEGVLYNKDMTELVFCPAGKSGTVEIPASVNEIEYDALFYCKSIQAISVESDSEDYASKDGVLYSKDMTELIFCPAGKSGTVEIPASVTEIRYDAFSYCDSLQAISVESDSKDYASKEGVLYNKDMTELVFCPAGKSGTVEIPASVNSINEDEYMMSNAFTNCDSLQGISVELGSEAYASKDGILYSKDMTELIFCPAGKSGVAEIPEGVIVICNSAFDSCKFLQGITIPSSVTNIEWYALPHRRNLIVYGISSSCAEEYAKIHHIKFVAIGTTQDTGASTIHTHTIVTDAAVAPTCTTSGKTEGSHCAECDEVIQAQETIPATGHTYEQTIKQATNRQDGSIVEKCGICGDVKLDLSIYAASHITLSKTTITYNAKSQKPAVTVKNSQGVAISVDNYDIAYPKISKKVGEYTVSVTLKGNYTGTAQLKYQIVPKGTSISKLTAKKKGFTVKWKKQRKETTGYQIQYSTSSSFKGAKTITVSKNETVSKEIKNLKAGKKYYVKIRTYMTVKVGGKNKKLYSEWSKTKTVNMKK